MAHDVGITPQYRLLARNHSGLLIKDGRCHGVLTGLGLEIESKTVILNEWYLSKWYHPYREKQFGGGRDGEKPNRNN